MVDMTDMIDNSVRKTVAVLGLGPMGVAIARAAAAKGHRVVLWSRTPRSSRELGLDGAGEIDLAAAPNAAVSGADLVVVCVRDHAASRAVIEQIAPALVGQVVVNVSTGTPGEAVDSASRAVELGVRYVTGAVMVPTPMVGTDDCLVIYAGSEADLADSSPLFAALQGSSDLVGDDHAVPPALDLAMLDIYFAGMYAHLHATALAGAHGIDAARFLPYAQGVVDTLGASLAGLTSAVERRSYDSGEARLDMCLSFLDHIVTSSRNAGIEPGLAELVRTASVRALTTWPGSTDWDVVAEDFMTTTRPGPG